MKISSVSKIYEAYNTKPAVSGKKTVSGEKKDNLNVSNQAREFQLALKSVSTSDDIREDRISDIKSSIENGTYNVSAEDVADKILSYL